MIRFTKYLWVYAIISALVLLPGVYALIRFGLKPSIDFSGGTLLELTAPGVSEDEMRGVAQEEGLEVTSIIASSGDAYLLRMAKTDVAAGEFVVRLASASGTMPILLRNEEVGPLIGKELLGKAITAAALAVLAILLYVARAFRNIKFGVSAVVALIHDLLVVIGVFAILGQVFEVEVDTLFVTAVLTTMSFSVHDTIVVFDRIREYMKRGGGGSFEQVVDLALLETMNRSLTNSLTIIFMLLSLALLGGETIRWFVVALLVGTISGTYSSPFVATPILVLWDRWERKKRG
jgi:preprotein translocase subunit SecF